MSSRIIFDGLNLALAQGTGIATYTRLLTRAARDLGHEVGVVYSTRHAPPRNPRLREIAFFDERAPRPMKQQPTWRRLIAHAVDQTLYHRPVRPLPVELTGAVISRHFEHTLAAQDHIFVAHNLFANARTFFSRTHCFVELKFDQRPDILHCTYPMPLRVSAACNVYTIHDLVPLRLPFTTLDDKRQTWRLLSKVAREADHIVTVSEHSKRDIVELLGVDERRITNTYQAIDFPAEFVARPEAAVASQIELSFGLEMRGYLLFYGALEPKKNVARLIEAYFAARVDVPLVLVISGGWQNEAETRLLAEHEKGVTGRAGRQIRRLDYVSLSMLVSLIRGARAVVFPSLYEGFGLPVLEAMALGTPVVASRAASLPEIAGEAALLVDPYDVDGMAQAIRTIVEDTDLAEELARRGPVQAANFSVARYRERIRALYAAIG
jgi:glycosyltransferase involved in cell wall biosynthesis